MEIRGRRLNDAQSMGMMFDELPDVPDDFPQNVEVNHDNDLERYVMMTTGFYEYEKRSGFDGQREGSNMA
jgi:hypothetical protein